MSTLTNETEKAIDIFSDLLKSLILQQPANPLDFLINQLTAGSRLSHESSVATLAYFDKESVDPGKSSESGCHPSFIGPISNAAFKEVSSALLGAVTPNIIFLHGWNRWMDGWIN